jgi:hypothetical protein
MRNLVLLFLVAAVFLCPMKALAAEKYVVCLYDSAFDVQGVSPEAGAFLEKAVLKDLKSRSDFMVIDKDALRNIVGKFSKERKIGENELVEAAGFAGIDLLALLEVKGKIKSAEDISLEELFSEEGEKAFSMKLKIYDVSHNEVAYDKAASFNELSEAKVILKGLLSEFDYPLKRGKIIKIEEGKAAINMGSADGVLVGQGVEAYEPAAKVKLGKNEVQPLGKKVAEAKVIKVTNNASLVELADWNAIKEGYYVETLKNIAVTQSDVSAPLAKEEKGEGKKAAPAMEKEGEKAPVHKMFNVGFDLGWPFYGLSFKFWPNEHGVGANYYQTSTSYGFDSSHFSCRYYYSIRPDFYLCAGLGQYGDTRYDYYGYSSTTIKYTESLWAILFGIKTSDYISYEFGYGSRTNNYGQANGMVTLGMGIHVGF